MNVILVTIISISLGSSLRSSNKAATSFSIDITRVYGRPEINTQTHFTENQLKEYKPQNDEEKGVYSTRESNNSKALTTFSLQASIEVGEPPQIIFVVFDTGSTNLLISNSQCESHTDDCPIKFGNFFPENSKNHKDTKISGEITFLCGFLKAKVGRDTVRINGLKLDNQDIGEVYFQDGNCILKKGMVGGILGLSPPEMKLEHTTTFLENLVKSKQLTNNIMSFYFPPLGTDQKGELTFGEIDNHLVKGPIKYYDSIYPEYWSVNMTQIMVAF